MLGNFCYGLTSLLTVSKLTFSGNSFSITISVSNGLDPDQDGHFVSPDLATNCLQMLSADIKICR